MRYQRIAALVDAGSAEAASIALAEAGLASEIIDETTLDKPPPGMIGLVVYLDEPALSPEPGGGAEARLRALFAEAGVGAAVTATLCDDETWRDKWKEYFKPRRVGRFVIAPSWEPYLARAGETVLEMDPGRAFGTGGHASTRLCLELLDGPPAASFLDVGCGSGVLAIACALLWPDASGSAIDVDPEAVEVTRENAEKNRVQERIAMSTTPLGDVAGRFALVLGNLSAETLTALAPSLCARVAPGGRLVASGILCEQADAVAAVLCAHGLTLSGSRDEEGWRGLVMARPF
ncbi:MAG: 50S ribosomal protein L11 methyltransferase [Myxococcales bacterium]|nr:50S ribosomal protein L11 methyltransferase [Myxococcales bacterium]